KLPAQREMQRGAVAQTLGLDADEGAAGVEGTLTGVEESQNIAQAFFILAEGELLSAFGLGGGAFEGGLLLEQELLGGEGGFDFAEGGKDTARIGLQRLIVAGAFQVDAGLQTTALKQGLRSLGADVPDGGLGADQLLDL